MQNLSLEELEALAHPGEIKVNGKWVDRSEVGFLMHKDGDYLRTLGGAIYQKDKKGSIRKVEEETR